MKKGIIELKAVVFDMDGLMFDSERIVQYSWNIAGEKLGFGALGENIYQTLGYSVLRRKEFFQEKYGKDFPFEVFREEYGKAFRDYVKNHGLPAKKGLHELLETLQKMEIPMAVATSSSESYARDNLEQEKISEYFLEVISGNMVKEAKPSPEIYLKACERLKVDPQTAMALEDSYNGIRSAYRAGMMPVMIPDLLEDTSPVEELLFAKKESLLEVAEWIRQWKQKE